jgi:hypothetical protein
LWKETAETVKEAVETAKETAETAREHYNPSNIVSSTAQGVERMWKKFKDKSGVIHCIAVKSSVPQGMIVCFDKEVVWCVGIAVILRGVGRV